MTPSQISVLRAALAALEWIRTETAPPVHGTMADMPTINACWEVADKAIPDLKALVERMEVSKPCHICKLPLDAPGSPICSAAHGPAPDAARREDGQVELPRVEEIKPCPYVNGFSSDNVRVSFMLKPYGGYSDFVLFDAGKPVRCFRFTSPTPEVEQSGWMPIDTCPVNTSVLIYLPRWEHYGPGIYRAIKCDMDGYKRWHTTAYACGRDLDPRDWPEWWMPLPGIPYDAKGQERG